MNYEKLREEAIEKHANPEDVDDAISTAKQNNLTLEETIAQIKAVAGVDVGEW